MAIDITQLKRPSARAKLITLCGEGGMGKTSLAATFPTPAFIRAEDGVTEAMNVLATPLLASSGELWEWFNYLLTGEHDHATCVIDTVTALDVMFKKEIVEADDKATSINQAGGGYGAGFAMLSDRHRMVREWAGALVAQRGMNVVFIAHADAEKVDPPDADAYTRYTLRLHRDSVTHYTDNVDCVAFIKQQMHLKAGDSDDGPKKAMGSGQRIITCHPNPAHVSKNRFDIETDLTFEKGSNPFAAYLPQTANQ